LVENHGRSLIGFGVSDKRPRWNEFFWTIFTPGNASEEGEDHIYNQIYCSRNLSWESWPFRKPFLQWVSITFTRGTSFRNPMLSVRTRQMVI